MICLPVKIIPYSQHENWHYVFCPRKNPTLENKGLTTIQPSNSPQNCRRWVKHHIPLKTDSWDVTEPGFTEIDLVSHSGDTASGEFVYSLNVTDIHTGWVETRAVMGRGEVGVVDVLGEIRHRETRGFNCPSQ